MFLYKNPALVGTYANDAASHGSRASGQEHSVVGSSRSAAGHQEASASTCSTIPKYSLPLRAGCPTAWVCHGLDWYVMPWASRRIDRLSHKFLVPRYARKADAIIAVSEITREHVIEFLPIPAERVFTRLFGRR